MANAPKRVQSRSLKFENAAPFMGLLLAVIIGGFWQAYFSRMLPNGDFVRISWWTHFHLSLAAAWMLLLIMQPILIRKKQFVWHRRIGRISYVLMPLLMISVLLLFHSRHRAGEPTLNLDFFVGCKDLIVLAVAFFCAVKFRHTAYIHARAMIATGIAFIEPALIRLLMFALPNLASINYLLTVLIIHTILLSLMVLERKQQRGRWVFPLIWGIYVVLHAIALSGVRIGVVGRFATWFVSLPLT